MRRAKRGFWWTAFMLLWAIAWTTKTMMDHHWLQMAIFLACVPVNAHLLKFWLGELRDLEAKAFRGERV